MTIDTQSDSTSTSHPPTEKQRDLGHLLVQKLLKIGVTNAQLNEHCSIQLYLPIPTRVAG